jgi:hypothetical protein
MTKEVKIQLQNLLRKTLHNPMTPNLKKGESKIKALMSYKSQLKFKFQIRFQFSKLSLKY